MIERYGEYLEPAGLRRSKLEADLRLASQAHEAADRLRPPEAVTNILAILTSDLVESGTASYLYLADLARERAEPQAQQQIRELQEDLKRAFHERDRRAVEQCQHNLRTLSLSPGERPLLDLPRPEVRSDRLALAYLPTELMRLADFPKWRHGVPVPKTQPFARGKKRTEPDPALEATELADLESFPYRALLAWSRQELHGPAALIAEIERLVQDDPRWMAHYESTRHLDLEQAAALHDGELLREFADGDATPFCRLVARTQGEVFVAMRNGSSEAAAGCGTAQAWSRHAARCVYCRRMKRRILARAACERAGLPAGEILLRDWLLEDCYRDALEDVTRRLAGGEPDAGPLTVVLDARRFVAVRDRDRFELEQRPTGSLRGWGYRYVRPGQSAAWTRPALLDTAAAPTAVLAFERPLDPPVGRLSIRLEVGAADRVVCRVELKRSPEEPPPWPRLTLRVEYQGTLLIDTTGDEAVLGGSADLPRLDLLSGTRLGVRVLSDDTAETLQEFAIEFED